MNCSNVPDHCVCSLAIVFVYIATGVKSPEDCESAARHSATFLALVVIMSLNWAMLDATRNPIPLPNDHTVFTVDKGAELSLTTPAGSKLQEAGKLILTEQRVSHNSFSFGKPSL